MALKTLQLKWDEFLEAKNNGCVCETWHGYGHSKVTYLKDKTKREGYAVQIITVEPTCRVHSDNYREITGVEAVEIVLKEYKERVEGNLRFARRQNGSQDNPQIIHNINIQEDCLQIVNNAFDWLQRQRAQE